ncbi:MAG TPA: beta-propeller fold lactonase family protein [Candidatus Angelobacter sp.]
MTVTSPSSSVAAGLLEQFNATGTFSDGSSKPLTGLTWTTSDPTLATVDGNGLVTTLKQGSVTISAASGTIKANAPPLTISPPLPTGLSLSGKASVVLGASTSAKLSALLSFTDKTTQDISSLVTWSNTNPFTATIDASGNIIALHFGYTKIAATNGTFSATTNFSVTAVPRFLYTSSDGPRILSKATIDPATGQMRMAGYLATNANGSAVLPCQTTDPSGQFLYVGSRVDSVALTGEAQIYNIDQATGTLTPLVGSPFPFPNAMDCIEFERTGKFGFASGSSINNSTQLLSFSRDTTTGALTLLATTTLPGAPTRVAVDPLGSFLFVGLFTDNLTSGAAIGFTIDPATGALTPIPGTPFVLPNTLGNFSFHPSGNFLYMANAGATSIDVYSVNRTTGQLTSVGSIATCVNPATVRFSPDGEFAYTACSEDAAFNPNSASVETFAVAANGTLTHLGSTPSSGSTFELNIDPSGQFIYLGSTGPIISVFAIGADGIARFSRKFGVQSNQGFTMAFSGGTAAVKYTPQFAYISSSGDNKLSAYAIRSDGTLGTPLSVATQLGPFSLALAPLGGDLLVASSAPSPNLTAFPLSASTGSPGLGVNFGIAATAGGVATDFSGPWAFETDAANGTVSTYGKFGPDWSLLIYLSNGVMVSSFAAGAGAGPAVIDPFGRFLFVANQGANSISAYEYFGQTPELNEAKGNLVLPFTDGSPFPVGAKPLALAVDPNEAFLYVLCNDQTLRVFAIDYFSGGHLAQVSSTSLSGPASGIATEFSGRYIYAAGANGLSAFAVSPIGALTSIPLPPGIAPTGLTGVYVEPSGQFLYITANSPAPGAVFAFSINPDGTLKAVSPNPVAVLAQPSSMAFSVDAR